MSVLEALVAVGLVVLLLFGYRITTWVLFYMLWGYLFCDINLEETYSRYSGIWHGEFFFSNSLRCYFNSDILYKTNDYTAAYNVWWIFIVVSVISFIFGGRRQEY